MHTLENIQRLLSPDNSDLGRIGASYVSDGFKDVDITVLQELLNGGDDKSDGKLSEICNSNLISSPLRKKSL